ncbi:MAG: hypothetical protein BWZ02_00998 [Lentisphaerae bacterium ADurb.BinA184]|nr:MAG: hypothetical protein BWZ02_00998 [Lentisphaerae bacterium ADurb.BinA184]
MSSLRARQVHLDFHTSEHIPDVGARFSKKQWQQALRLGCVNSINIFAKCHHGWSYYPTQVGHTHPTLRRDLLGEQIAACHEMDVRAPIYFTVGWSANDAETHPEWCVRHADGSIAGVNIDPKATPDTDRPTCSWKFLCPSGGYLELIVAQTTEICRRYAVDGFWYDICSGPVCYCQSCRAGMAAEGVDAGDAAAAAAYNVRKWRRFYTACRQVVEAHHPGAVLYFNGTTHLHILDRLDLDNTQQDLEDLPTTWGGYNRFPLRARFYAREPRPYVAMSGKFHTSWGEFGGFKHPDALRYEAAAMVAYGAGCNFGDQLHPGGEMDLATYRNIGHAFRYVKRIEPYGLGGRPHANLAVWWGLKTATSTGAFALPDNHHGISEMLLDTQTDYEIADTGDDLTRFDAIILPGAACLDEAAAAQLNAWRKAGGKLLILGEGGLDAATRSRFLLDVGAEYVGGPRHKIDYLIAGRKLRRGLVESPFLNIHAGIRVRLTDGVALATVREPYFDRTYGHYCSHMNTPYRLEDAGHPGAWMKAGVVCLANPLGCLYHKEAARLHRELFLNALRLVYPRGRQTLVTDMPSGARVSLVHQPERRRYAAHLLYGPPMPRGRCQVIEDLVPLYDVPVRLRVPESIRKASLPLERKPLRLSRSADAVTVTVPRVQCHQVVLFEY